jgi:hypothetical protein
MAKKLYTGINIQYPISRMILDGSKVIETRTYPIPQEYIGKEMAIIETPGKSGQFKSRVIGLIVFGNSFKYESERDFYKDEAKHCVDRKSSWAWDPAKGKWGWPIVKVVPFETEVPLAKRSGIKYSRNIELRGTGATV